MNRKRGSPSRGNPHGLDYQFIPRGYPFGEKVGISERFAVLPSVTCRILVGTKLVVVVERPPRAVQFMERHSFLRHVEIRPEVLFQGCRSAAYSEVRLRRDHRYQGTNRRLLPAPLQPRPKLSTTSGRWIVRPHLAPTTVKVTYRRSSNRRKSYSGPVAEQILPRRGYRNLVSQPHCKNN